MTLLLLLSMIAGQAPAGALSWSNPLVEQRADPHVTYHDGHYLMIATVPEYDRIELRRAPSLDTLRDAEPVVIWRRHANGPMSWHIWAPELHRIDGRWYVYFAAGRAEDMWAIRMYVLENTSADPFTGAWAQKDPDIEGNTNLYLAKMNTPWSIAGEPVMLSKPDLPWEREKYLVNEGPAALIRNGRVFMTYSASATNEYYSVGLLTADAGADLLDPSSWHKSPKPVFATWSVNGVFGPGHNSFTTTPDGKTDILVYHARSYRDLEGHELSNPDRHTRAQPIAWRPRGAGPGRPATRADRAETALPRLRTWGNPRALALASDRVIDASVLRLADGTWRMWYNNERDGKSIYFADSPDLATWHDRGKAVGDQGGEGPAVFRWRGTYWMITDVWDGLAVYCSADAKAWRRQPGGNLLQQPGLGVDDGVKGGHAGVVVDEASDRAFVFYFTHPDRSDPRGPADGYEQRRSSIQVVELHEGGGRLTVDRDAPTYLRLTPPR